MKSSFFSTFEQGDERQHFLRDVIEFLRLDTAKRNKFLDELPSILNLHEDDRRESIDRLSFDMNINISQGALFFDFVNHIIRFREEYPEYSNDKPSDWADDVVALSSENRTLSEIGPDKARELAIEVATRIWQIAENFKPEYNRQSFARGVLPKFKDIDSTVELRAVIEPSFSNSVHNRNDLSVTDYQPSIIDLVGIASIHLETDSNAHYYFQMEERDLRLAIRFLTATLRELLALRDRVALQRGDAPPQTS
jgi:hypothetical protein